MNIIKLPIADITPYEQNAKVHSEEQIKHIINSIERFGMNDPIGVWGENNIVVEGHGRLLALRKMGQAEADCIRLDHLTEEERRAYTLAHNQTAMETPFDLDLLFEEMTALAGEMDMSDFGFNQSDIESMLQECGGNGGGASEASGTAAGETKNTSTEIPAEAFGEETFEHECPRCGFKYNEN